MSERLPRQPATKPAAEKKPAAGGPWLFGDAGPPATASAYPAPRARPAAAPAEIPENRHSGIPAAPAPPWESPDLAVMKEKLRPVIHKLAEEVLAEADRRLSDAVRRALEAMKAGNPETARAILECAIEEWGRAA